MRLRRHRQFFEIMSSKVLCYLRTLRLGWRLTQEEVASLLPKGSRNRVADVEQGVAPPNAEEIVAYSVIFGVPAEAIFPELHADIEDAVVRGAYALHEKAEGDKSLPGHRRRQLAEEILARTTRQSHVNGV